MAQATITLTGEGVQDIHQLDMQISVVATIRIDATTARRRVTAWLVSDVANLLVGGTPQLIIGQQTLWRVPVLLTSSQVGTVGQVGTVDVDATTGQVFTRSELKKQIVTNAKNALPVPHRLQLADGYCLPACVQMVLGYWGIDQDQAKLAKQLKTIPGVGTPASNVRQLASRRLAVTFGSGTLTDLRSALTQGVPPIAMVKTQMLPYWEIDTAHAIVLLALDENSVILHDPAKDQGAIEIELGYFDLAWEEMVHYYSLIKRI